ncbi:MAG: hypothetical protein R3C68_16115 [Myxococcota bacterium]
MTTAKVPENTSFPTYGAYREAALKALEAIPEEEFSAHGKPFPRAGIRFGVVRR